MAVSSAAVLATVLGSAVALAGPAAADPPALSVSDISVSQVAQDTTTTIPGLAFSGAGDSNVLQVTVSTDVGTLNLPTQTGLTLAFGYSSWSGATLSFSGTQADVNTALADLQMLSGDNGGTTAHVSANAFLQQDNLVYSAPNQHFYQYFPSADISWTDANAAAQTQSYGGLTGYLATIPNDAVNDLVASKIQGASNVWFGAHANYTNATYPRTWTWAGGPLAGQLVSACTTLTLTCDFATGTDGLNGDDYSHWASSEPNNSNYSGTPDSGENSAVTNWGGSVGNWNDLPDSASDISGYLVEYGDQATGSTTQPVGTASTSDSIAVYGPPTAPTAPAATVSGTSATVSWAAPDNTGGSPVTGYTVTASPGGATCVPTEETPLSCTLTGLTKGTSYTFSVVATNIHGDSDGATSNSVVPPITVPGSPTALTATGQPSAAGLSFSAPVDNGGTAITGYEVSTDGGDSWQTLTTSGTDPITATVDGLTNGQSYALQVRARNSVGAGDAATAASVIPSATPSAPPIVKASVTAPVTMKIVTQGNQLPVVCKLTVRKIGNCSVQLVYKNSIGSYLVGTGSFRTTGTGTAGQVAVAVTFTPLGHYLAYFHTVPSWVYASITPYGSAVPLAAIAHTSFVNYNVAG
jgi:hypothetical protein